MAHGRLARSLARAVALVLVVSTVGCKLIEKLKPHHGSPCAGETSLCSGASALICHDGKYFETRCRGPKGCRVSGELLTCDVSLDTDDDHCPSSWEGKGSCSDKKDALVACHDGAFERTPCRGPKGCWEKGASDLACDMSAVAEGDPCETEGSSACSADHATMFDCVKSKMAHPQPCRGPKGCLVENKTVTCDKSIGVEGDECTEGGVCNAEHDKVLGCKGGKLAVHQICRGGPCVSVDGNVVCEKRGYSEPGDPCEPDIAACSTDGKSVLKCVDGKLVKKKACACAVSGDDIVCR